ncbi:MAG TPA: hypothetical protein VE225_05590 [Rubrobacteraceae bacterium]|nr:hypothetical protein [Rubrobacteraceae bacterium]
MRSYELYREAELEAALGADRLRAREVRRLVDRAVRSSVNGIVITTRGCRITRSST